MKPPVDSQNVPAEERARRRKAIIDSNPDWACLTCLITFRYARDYHDHMRRLHDSEL